MVKPEAKIEAATMGEKKKKKKERKTQAGASVLYENILTTVAATFDCFAAVLFFFSSLFGKLAYVLNEWLRTTSDTLFSFSF